MSRILGLILALLLSSPALAGVPCSLPFTLTNGTLADATQVMANYNALVTCLTNAAAAGANNDITSLTGLTSPILPTQGGSNLFIASQSNASVGNSVVLGGLSPTGYANIFGYTVFFVPSLTTTGAVTAAVNGQPALNVLKPSSGGLIPLTGQEIVSGQGAFITFDGVEFILQTTAGFVSTTATNQIITGGANVGVAHLGTFNAGNTVNVNCGLGPIQDFTNNGNITIAAPSLAGSCVLRMINSAGAGTVSFSGFTTNANTGEALDTTNGHTFFISVVADGLSTYMIKALQ